MIYRGFERVALPVAWVEFVGGLVALILTAFGFLPPFGDDLWGRVLTCIAWLLFAQEGFHELRDRLEEELLGKVAKLRIGESREICKLCGEISTVGFDIPEQVWNEVVNGRWNVLCLRCFTRLADEMLVPWSQTIDLFPQGRA